jgi:hypothetical protein
MKHSRSMDRWDRGFFAPPTYRKIMVAAHRQVTQMKSLALVFVSWLWTVVRMRIRILLLENLTSFRYRLWLALELSEVLSLLARLGAAGRSRGIFRSTVSSILVRNLYLLLHWLCQHHALGVLFPILLGKLMSTQWALCAVYGISVLRSLCEDPNRSGAEV